jgi:acyl-CoA reductase-like NAD-dependent aldehyde dehydrogenase
MPPRITAFEGTGRRPAPSSAGAQPGPAALQAGNVSVNGFTGIPTSAPFGGVKQSGHGRLGGVAGIREFTRPKNIWIAM